MATELPALDGGTPVRSGSPVPFFRADLSDADIAAVTETLRSGWLTLGPRVGEFEAACARDFLPMPRAVRAIARSSSGVIASSSLAGATPCP